MKKLFNFCLIMSAVTIVAFGFANGGLRIAEAHPPCNAPAPYCRFESSVNPWTGEMERHWICD